MNTKAGAKGAVSGAAAGAAFGPWGAAAGGVIGGIGGLLSDDGSDEKAAAAAAEAAKIAQEKKNAIALSDYRLNSKNQYDTLKNNVYAPYAGYSQRLQGAYGQGMSGPQQSAVSLADTGIAAPEGSLAAGWDDKTADGKYLPGGAHTMGQVTHHTGYNEYLNGTGQVPGSTYYTREAVNTPTSAGTQRFTGTTVDAVQGGLPQGVQPTFMPGSNAVQLAPAGATAPGTQYKFFPGGR